jgi:glycine cleavage system H protein
MPVKAVILEMNKLLEHEPDLVNRDPYGNGWIIKVSLSDLSQIDNLLSAGDYNNLVS